MKYAPLIVFAYNRPEHLRRTLESLAANAEAVETDLFIFIDGPKENDSTGKTNQVLQVAKNLPENWFKSVSITASLTNRGLAAAVIHGVSEVINQYGYAIVTEDDSLVDISYLKFMNEALNFYENVKDIWSVGGYCPPMRLPEEYKYGVVKTQRCSSYAWATWKDRWQRIDWDMSNYNKFRFNFSARKAFNQWGEDRASMLDDQMNHRVNSWAIRFDYSMYENKMYNIVPAVSLVKNIGHDGSGTHSTVDSSSNDSFAVDLRNEKLDFELGIVQENEDIRREFCRFFQTSKWDLLKRFISNLFMNWRNR